MKRRIRMAAVVCVVCVLSGCNTMAGIGRDAVEISDRLIFGLQSGFDAQYDREDRMERRFDR